MVTMLCGTSVVAGGGGGGSMLEVSGVAVAGTVVGVGADSPVALVKAIATPPTATSAAARPATPKTNCGKRCHDRCSSTSMGPVGGTYCDTGRVWSVDHVVLAAYGIGSSAVSSSCDHANARTFAESDPLPAGATGGIKAAGATPVAASDSAP